jgi:hypothetical protein
VCLSVFYFSFTSFDSWPLFLWYPLSSSFSQFFFLYVHSFFFSDVISLSLPLWRNPIGSVTSGFLFYFTLHYPFLSISVRLLSMPSSHRCVRSTELIGWRPGFSFRRRKKEKNELSKSWTGFRTKTLIFT